MAFTKVWAATDDGDYSDYLNWKPISVRNAAFAWTASGSGTNEYYLRTAASGDPDFAAKPNAVLIDGEAATEGTVGSLTAGQWGYDDNDTLGYSTLYVRLADGADPDSKALDYITFQQTPKADEHVRLPPNTASITEGLDQSSVSLASFVVEEGYAADIGSIDGYLRINTDRFEYAGIGQAFIDLTTSAVDPEIRTTGSPSVGEFGLYLVGSAIDVLSVREGTVGVAVLGGESATVATARLVGPSARLVLGPGCACTTFEQQAGSAELRMTGTATTVLVYAGDLTTRETVAITTLTQYGGVVIANATGTITTYNIHGGQLDLRQSGASRTITTLNLYSGSYTINRNKEAVTIGTEAYQATVDMTIGSIA